MTSSVLAFYWVAFTKKKSISKQRADDVGDSLVFIGLLYFTRRCPEVLKLTISHIRSILESYCEITESPDDYAIGDMLAHLWTIRMVLVARKNTALTATVDEALTKPPALTDEKWQIAQSAISLRREQQEKRVLDRNALADIDPDKGEALAHQLLREA